MKIGGIEIPLSRAKICLILDDKKDYLFYDQKLTKQELCNSAERLISKLEIFILANKIPQNKTRITFENVSSNILCGGNGERKLLDLTLPITPGNEVQCNTAYCKSGKLRVIVEWEK